MLSLREIVNITLANGGVSCFFKVFDAFVFGTRAGCLERCLLWSFVPAIWVTAPVVKLFYSAVLRNTDMQPKQQNSFTYDELISCAKGEMFGPGNPQLPLPPMLMCDRITHIDDSGGAFGKGLIEAELDIQPDLWFFPCHFEGDPVMPGCLGMDALWQLVGFFLGWSGGLGRGRALSVGEVKFTGQILPENKRVQFHLDMKRVIMQRLVMGIADGKVLCDGEVVFEANDIRVGLFTPEGN